MFESPRPRLAPDWWCCKGVHGSIVCLIDNTHHKLKIDHGPLSKRLCDRHDAIIMQESK